MNKLLLILPAVFLTSCISPNMGSMSAMPYMMPMMQAQAGAAQARAQRAHEEWLDAQYNYRVDEQQLHEITIQNMNRDFIDHAPFSTPQPSNYIPVSTDY